MRRNLGSSTDDGVTSSAVLSAWCGGGNDLMSSVRGVNLVSSE